MMTRAAIETWLAQPAAQAVGWALLQFVWQGAAVGALTALALLALRRGASDDRYVVASIGLALMLTLPVVTGLERFAGLRAGTAQPSPRPAAAAASAIWTSPRANPPGATTATASYPAASVRGVTLGAAITVPAAERLIPVLMLAWLAGVSVLSLRLFSSWLWVQRLRTHGVRPADEGWRDIALRLCRRMHVGRVVTLLESALVEVPTVIGFIRPVVLLPATALAGLSAQQIEAILAHELAHIRRHDYLVNLLQTLVETVLFYHPAVWWLSRRIRIERENCCDDLAVSLCGDPVAYAGALADLEALRSGPAPGPHVALAATGGSLLQRVRRLLGAPSSHTGRGPAWLAATAALSLIGCVAYSSGPARGSQDARRLTAVEANRRDLRDISRAFHTEVRAAQGTIRRVARTFHQALPVVVRRHALPPRAAAPAVAPAVAPEAGVRPPIAQESAQSASPARVSHSVHDSTGNWIWSSNGDRLQVSYSGRFEFSDDDRDIRAMSAGGWLKISDGSWLGRHSVEMRERGGRVEHLYYVNGVERPYEPEGRAWLEQHLPPFVRGSGIGAEARVARLLRGGGPAAVLAEIGRIDGIYVKGVYFRQLFKQGQLSADQYRLAMAQAAREMRSSAYELASLLIAAGETLPADEASRAAYFEAAGGVTSDYELRRVHSTMLKRGPVSPAILSGILVNARAIGSDYELAELLRQVLAQQPLDERNRAPFFAAVATIGGAYERHRVLAAVVSAQHPTDPGLLQGALSAAGALRSDYEASTFLQEVLRQNDVEGGLRAPFFSVVDTIGSGYERGRVLQTVAKKTGASPETLRAVLQSSRALNGYELSQLLQAVAGAHVLTGDVRDAFLDATERLGGYEQGQVMTALVRSERRR